MACCQISAVVSRIYLCCRPWDKGLSLTDLADIMISQGATYAVNLDGGGSSVLTSYGHVISQPTCVDIPILCERAVSTTICIACPQGSREKKGQKTAWFPPDGRLPLADRFLVHSTF